MNKIPVIAIFDVGKTNKKLIFFNEQYKIVYEEYYQINEIADEEGFPCENIKELSEWILCKYAEFAIHECFEIRAINFSAYGASFVHIDSNGKLLTPLYNYLKPFPENIKEQFYKQYPTECSIAKQTASPVLGNLNSGMQLYCLKYESPEIYAKVKYSLHLPQYLSYLISSKAATEITSLGCHTQLWDFEKNNYHKWVFDEGLTSKLAPIYSGDKIEKITNNDTQIIVGMGLHDSSAALIGYLAEFEEPFVLLSTGTWSITLNPFNYAPLSEVELRQDCLCYLSYKGNPVKASRLLAGPEHEIQTKRMAAHFKKAGDYFSGVKYDNNIIQFLKSSKDYVLDEDSSFEIRNLNTYLNYEVAYHQLIADMVAQQRRSTNLVLNDMIVKRIYVDGGFSKNEVYMHLLANIFTGFEVYAATVAQASALGAALAIHHHWNDKALPDNIIEVKLYSV